MSLGLAVLLIFSLGLVYLLWAPIHLSIRTDQKKMFIGFHVWLQGGLRWDHNIWLIYVRIFGLEKQWDLIETLFRMMTPKNPSKPKKVNLGKSQTKTSAPIKIAKWKLISTGWAVLRSWRVKRWKVGFDTGDPIVNAQIIPFAAIWTAHSRFPVEICFDGRTQIEVHFQNSLGKLIYTSIYHYLKS